MITLTCYGGAETIGGNKLLVEDGGTRFFLDFGTDYELMDCYFEEFLNPRPARGLLDYLEMGLLPPLEG
ncbi:MAG: MBL fold metallo-hydrolase, partial [Chloroflexota bacterium]|nr:MBL fold metallo-hydrolase [Chloroflexota bacterium]